ncbi:MAG: cupin domain-containing protein [Actinobacteria bacterium]|nr:cupin domain-containing protein [Actinomycetota bacterium]
MDVTATHTPATGAPPALADLERWFEDEGLQSSVWSNEPGYVYAEHSHPYRKILFCVRGSITFRTADGEFALQPGDRLDVDAGTTHGAVVGDDGVTCIEAASS